MRERPRHVSDMEQAVNAAHIDECAVVPSGSYRASGMAPSQGSQGLASA